MQALSIIAILTVVCTMLMNWKNNVTVSFLNEKFATLTNLSQHSLTFDLAIYTLVIYALGMFTVLFFLYPLYNSLKEKYNAYKRELEKGSITNTSSTAKIKVLENKISVLEKALDDAIKKGS